eukprot:9223770-Pyramimonas_sp.AAC.1
MPGTVRPRYRMAVGSGRSPHILRACWVFLCIRGEGTLDCSSFWPAEVLLLLGDVFPSHVR